MDNKWTWDDFCDFDDKDAFKIHNADCEAYEKRIAELEAELAGQIGYNKTFIAQINDDAERFAKLEADRDALQREKDALTEVYAEVSADLARVKAESLRVVKCGEAVAVVSSSPWTQL